MDVQSELTICIYQKYVVRTSLSLLFQDFLNLKDLLDCWTLIHTSYNTCVLFIGPYYFALLSLSLISSFVCVVVVAGREREREREVYKGNKKAKASSAIIIIIYTFQ